MSQVKVPGQEDGSTREQMSTPKKKHMIPLNLKQFLFKPTTLLSIFYTHPKIERVTMKHAIFLCCVRLGSGQSFGDNVNPIQRLAGVYKIAVGSVACARCFAAA